MSPQNTPSHTESIVIARDLLRLIAQKPQLETVAPTILGWAKRAMSADACFLWVAQDPYLFHAIGVSEAEVPPLESFGQAHGELAPLQHVESAFEGRFAYSLFHPIQIKQKQVGGLCLLFNAHPDLGASHDELMSAICDALMILMETAKTHTRHEKLMRNQAEFVRIISHDLRTPLTSILGFASMMESGGMGDLNERQHYFIEKIMSGVAQMTSLVDNIQDAGRYDPETGFYQMERAPCDLNELAERIVQNQLVPAEKMDLALEFIADPEVPIINVDHRMLERSIINLVDNAIKYTPNGGHIQVRIDHDDEEVRVTVRDNGLGISLENMRQLFQRHYRIRRPEHKKVKGSGLGLFIVRSVALQHGGEAFVESVEGEGSVFGLRIPLRGANLLTAEQE